jgi:hypothetical protein
MLARCRGFVVVAVLALATVSTAWAQAPPARVKLGAGGMNVHPGADTHLDTGKLPKTSADPTKPHRPQFVVAPIPVINPTIGNGLAGVGMVTLRLDADDAVSPPSVFGGGGMYTSSKSWAWGVGTSLFLMEDRFRIIAGVGDGNLNYDWYGTGHDSGEGGRSLAISQAAAGLLVEPKVRVFERLYVGPRYLFARTTVALRRDSALLPDIDPGNRVPQIPPLDLEVDIAALGVRVERDSRDSQFYPRTGGLIDLKIDFFSPKFGGDRSFQSYEVAYQGYNGIGSKNVIAYRAAVCAVEGDAPFYGLCLLGKSQDIRGYPVGRYQDRRMIVGQVEYRRELPWRFGLAAFFGLGEVAESFGDFNRDNLLPGGGVGVRFTVSEEDHINLRADYAWGRDSSAFYIGVLEVF